MIERIAIFVPTLNGGGAERVMVSLANGFSARGYHVDMLLAKAEGVFLNFLSPNVRVFDLRAGRVVRTILPLVFYLRRERPSAFLAAMTHSCVIALIAKFLSFTKPRLVVSERGTVTQEFRRAKGLLARIVYNIVPFLYQRADAVHTVSLASANDLSSFARLPLHRIKTIYNPFDVVSIRQRKDESISHPWFATGEGPVIVAIGRLNQAKDFSTLIRAFSLVKQKISARLLILGEGELRDALEQLILSCGLTCDDVQLHGFVANPYAYLARANLFVLSSQWEGLPGALIEAMACGTPVVSTNCPSGPDEILEGGRWGRLVPVGDIYALATAILDVLSTPRDQLPDVTLRAQDFDQEKALDAYLEILGLPPSPSVS